MQETELKKKTDFQYSSKHKYSIKELYDHKIKTSHQVDGYNIAPQYFDYYKSVENKSDAKANRSKLAILNKGSYQDEWFREMKKYPKPKFYEIQLTWPNPKPDPSKFKSKPFSKRLTFIDKIMNASKDKITPGVGSYNLFLTDEQIKQRNEKLGQQKYVTGNYNYLGECQYQGITSPAPGQYYKFKLEQVVEKKGNNYKEMIEKHKNDIQKIALKKHKTPSPTKYNPSDPNYRSFTDFQQLVKNDYFKNQPNGKYMMGKDKRFVYQKNKKNKKEFPGPNHYNTMTYWKGKKNELNKEMNSTNSFFNSISKGPHTSIYYSKH